MSSFAFTPLTKSDSNWQNDSAVRDCNICAVKLTGGLFKSGKHHCRQCGRIICGKCSKYQYKNHKICKDCNDKIHNNNESKKQHITHVDDTHDNNMSMQQITIKQIDNKLAEYYKKLGVNDYYNTMNQDSQIGKFELWCDDNGFDDAEQMKDEFGDGAKNCVLLEFDPDFPLKGEIDNEQQRLQKIFGILKDIFEGKYEYLIELEGKDELLITDFELKPENIENQMVITYKTYKQYIKTFADDFTDINLLYFVTISKMNNLLLNIIDSYKRYEVEYILNNYKSSNINQQQILDDWISKSLFLQKLNDIVQRIKVHRNKIDAELEEKTFENMNNFKLDLAATIRVYQKRIMPRLIVQNNSCLINDQLEMIAKYIVASSTFMNQLINQEFTQQVTQDKSLFLHPNTVGGAPCLVDFIFLLPTISRYQQYAKSNDIIGDVLKRLTKNEIKMVRNYINPSHHKNYTHIQRMLVQGFHGLRKQLTSEDKSYPSYRRFNVLIDRRCVDECEEKENLFVVFEPPNDCNTIPRYHVPEKYFDLSRICLVPGIVNTNESTIDSTTIADGQIMTFSYHVWTSDKIKLYLYWRGQCHRFYPQDIKQILPKLFNMDEINKKFIKSDYIKALIQEMKTHDMKFEQFYRGLHELPKSKFPCMYI